MIAAIEQTEQGAVEQIIRVKRTRIKPSPLNPRTIYPRDYLEELAQNIKNNGLINALIVREIEDYLEIIAGECRWRSSEIAGLEDLPVIVRNLPDSVVLELMVSENMKRRDLTPMEELGAFTRMMGQKNEDGSPLYPTKQALADKIGVPAMYVNERLSLAKLSAIGRKALAEEKISFATARVICRCPASIIEKVEDEVLNPKKYERWRESTDAMTATEASELIHEKYVRELRGAPFELSDPNLVPVHTNDEGERVDGGACTDCSWNSGNQAVELEVKRGGRGRGRPTGEGKSCLNPTCFQKKVDVNIASQLMKAKDEGCKILSDEESKKNVYAGGSLHHNSIYVKLNEKPDVEDLANNVSKQKVQPWAKLVEGESKPPIVIAVDENGGVHRLVERKLAIAAAQANGKETILNLSSGRARSQQSDHIAAQRKRDLEKAKERGACARAVMGALVDAVTAGGLPAGFWEACRGLAALLAQHDGAGFVCIRRGIEKKPDVYEPVKKALKAAEGNALIALILELLLSRSFSWMDNPHSGGCVVPDVAKPILTALGIDAAKVMEAAKKELAAKKVKKSKKPAKAETAPGAPESANGGKPTIMELKKKLAAKVKAEKSAHAKLPGGRKPPRLSAVGRAKIVKAMKERFSRFKKPAKKTPAAKLEK